MKVFYNFFFRVTSKKTWLKLRDDFFTKQKEEISRLKEELVELNKELEERQKAEKKAGTEDIGRGCIIKVTLDSSKSADAELLKLSRQDFREKMLKIFEEQVAYVDVEKLSSRVLIRCKSTEAAQALVQDAEFIAGSEKSLLSGREEDEYFEKIASNRKKKLDKKEKKEAKSKDKVKNFKKLNKI